MIGKKVLSEIEDRLNDSNVKGYVHNFMDRKSTAAPRRLPWLVAGVALGAAAMYLLDPEKGSKRRSTIKAKASDLSDTIMETGADVFDGVKASAQSLYSKVAGVSEEVADVAEMGFNKAQASVREANTTARNAAASAKSPLQLHKGRLIPSTQIFERRSALLFLARLFLQGVELSAPFSPVVDHARSVLFGNSGSAGFA
jgi:gas vesicle protein